VFAIGVPVLTTEGRWLAAVLACGPAAALSHRSAAALWGLLATSRHAIDVTRPGRSHIRAGIQVHRARAIRPHDVTAVRGVPCTAVARTLLDLSEVVSRRRLERALDQAEMLRILDASSLEELLDRSAGRRGAPILRAVLGDHRTGAALTRSELEDVFLGICRSAGIAHPEVNAVIEASGGALEVDFMWRLPRLIVETDGHRTHGTRAAFERDRRRDQLLALAGWRVVRFTWRQITRDPDAVVHVVRGLLSR
jgi:hypothetical protein